MDQDLLKITYHHPSETKMNTYMQAGEQLKHAVESVDGYLFAKREQPRCEIRFYWIDNEGDEIDIVSQNDYTIFLGMSNSSRHIHVAPVASSTSNIQNTTDAPKPHEGEKHPSSSSEPETQIPPADDNNVHLNVECDSCLTSPIIGFRYKCIQCSNYDLCQKCEEKHVHSDHMMIRMPNNGCPHFINAFLTKGRKSTRNFEKRCKTGETPRPSCSFASTSTGTGGSATCSGESTDANGQEGHRHGRKHRRHVRHNFLSNLYEMMHDLAEGGGEDATAAAMGDDKTTTEQEGTSNGSGNTTHDAFVAAETAKKVAAKAAEVAAKVSHQAALSAAAAAVAGLNERNGPTTSSQTAQQPSQTEPIFPSPSLEGLSQLMSPQYMKAGIDILNNFSDMFAKMLDPVNLGESSPTGSCAFGRKDSTTSTQSANSKKSNDTMNTTGPRDEQDNKQNECDTKKAAENAGNENETKSVDNSLVDVADLGSDSESDGIAEGFVKLNVPTKENTPEKAGDSTDNSEVIDFAKLSADLKAHIAEVKQQEEVQPTNNTEASAPQVERELRAVLVLPEEGTQDKPDENAPIYHSDDRINSAVRLMMSMGFANEGAMLTQLLVAVNGNVSEAIDILMAAQQ